MLLKTRADPSAVDRVNVNKVTIGRLVGIAILVCISGPVFAFEFVSEPQAATASMIWLGLFGLAVAGSPRKRDAESEPGSEG